MSAEFALELEIVFVPTIQQTFHFRFKLTRLCMLLGIFVHVGLSTSFCWALKLKTGKSVFDYLVNFFFGIYCSAKRTGSRITLFHMPALFTFSAQKTRALSALNWIVHHEWTNFADKVFIYRPWLNNVFFVELALYCRLALNVLQMRSYCLLGKLLVGFKHFFVLLLNH